MDRFDACNVVPPTPDSINQCLANIIAYPCTDISRSVNLFIDQKLREDISIDTIRNEVKLQLKEPLDQIVHNQDLLDNFVKLNLSLIEKYNCAVSTLNKKLGLTGDDQLPEVNRRKVVHHLGQSIGCCGLCVRNNLFWFIFLGVLILLLIIFVGLMFKGKRV